MEKIVAIVVTYNRKELLKECINALINQDYPKCDILVVDNASTDGTKEYIVEELKNGKVHYINTGSNLGGAGGFNYGMKEAYNMGYEYMWLMDDDCIVKDDSLKELLKMDQELDGNYGFLSSKVLWKDESICKMNIPKRSLFKKVEDWNINIQEIIMATFVSFFIKASVVKELGLPIKDFFIWADDIEYSRRISRKYKCYLVNSSVVIHKSKNNIGSNIIKDNSENISRYKYAYRNEQYLYKREGLVGKLYYKAKIIYHILKLFFSKNNNNSQRKCKKNIIISAEREGRKFNPNIEYVE